MGSLFGKEANARDESLVERSVRSLRGVAAAVGGAAVLSPLADLGTAAKELTKAERRRRQRQRERDEEDDDRTRSDRDDDDDDWMDDRLSVLRARLTDMRDRGSSPTRRETSRQSADDPEDRGSGAGDPESDDGDSGSGGRRNRSEEDGATERGTDDTEAIQAPQSVEPESTEPDSTGAIRIGSGDTFASIDPETGTAIAESNGVRAIAGPEGAFIEGTPGTSSPPPATDGGNDGGTRGGTGAGDGGGNGTGDDAGGDNGEDFAS